MIPLSVIIPFYNAESHIRRTTESLLNQTLKNIEYIFIDDGSTDSSKSIILDVISSYPDKQSQVIIADSSPDGKNCGTAQTRQTGLDLAHGDYVIFCDSDDWLDNDYYEQLYQAAIDQNADMAVGDHCTESENKITRISSPDIKNWDEFKVFPHWFHLSLWNRLIKLSLIRGNELRFFKDINFSEDYGFIMRVYYYSSLNCNVHSNSLYHYNKTNDFSLTKSLSTSSQFQRIKCIQLLDAFFKSKNENLKKCEVHNKEKFCAKDELLNIGDFALWKETFPSAAKMILRDPIRKFTYKFAYISGQYISWRILRGYHSLHNFITRQF